MFYLRILDSEFDAAEAKVAGLFPQFMVALQQALNVQLELLAENIQITGLTGDPLKTRSGELSASVQAQPATNLGTYIEGYVKAGGDDAPYARYFVSPDIGGTGGTAAHPITAHMPPMSLHFFWEKIGEEVWFKKVNHPGFPEKDFITGAFQAWCQDLPPYMQAAVDSVIANS